MYRKTIVLFSILTFSLYAAATANDPTSYSVMAFGATGNGLTLETAQIQNTIDQCAAQGGGMVYFPPTNYLTGTLYLKDNITLHIPAGSQILGSPDIANYPANHPDIEFYSSKRIHFALLYAEGEERGHYRKWHH